MVKLNKKRERIQGNKNLPLYNLNNYRSPYQSFPVMIQRARISNRKDLIS